MGDRCEKRENKIVPPSELLPREMDMVMELAYVRMLRSRSDVFPERARQMSDRERTVSSGTSGRRGAKIAYFVLAHGENDSPAWHVG